MFTFTGNNTDHSGGAAVEDEIVRDTGRAMGQILAAARAFIHSRGRKGSKGVPMWSRYCRASTVTTRRPRRITGGADSSGGIWVRPMLRVRPASNLTLSA